MWLAKKVVLFGALGLLFSLAIARLRILLQVHLAGSHCHSGFCNQLRTSALTMSAGPFFCSAGASATVALRFQYFNCVRDTHSNNRH